MKLKGFYILLFVLIAVAFCGGCRRSQIPVENLVEVSEQPVIVPDYTGLVIPPNIAPMNFEIDMEGDEHVAVVTVPSGRQLVNGGKVVKWKMDDWHRLLESAKGEALTFDVYVRNGDEWKKYSFTNTVAEEEIDPYLTYRLIEPSYEQYAAITINQRDLTSFEENVVHNNAAPCDERRGQCMNCHVPRNHYKDRASQFHVRKTNGGTVIMTGDSVRKVNLKTDSTLSAGVYPAWHPTLDLIAYSTNETEQKFLKFGHHKVEVYDKRSDLILYDIADNRVTNIAADPELLETFPAWSPDGKKLFYSVARYPDGVTPENLSEHHAEIRYDIVSRDFDTATMTFSAPDTVVRASAAGNSALLPRISPDGKYLLYCMAPFGTFHIWHKESDLRLLNLATGEDRSLDNANSDATESYHTWASSGRWIVFSSRRGDGTYTRPYIAYIDKDGKESKAFVVPQENPRYYQELMKSYNVPEFLVQPFSVPRHEIVKAINSPALQAVSPPAP